ncbi:MAG: hypothetical protein QM754_05365 [Tepidisphaeraceae bacterium]
MGSGKNDSARLPVTVELPAPARDQSLDELFQITAGEVLGRFRRAMEGLIYSVAKTLSSSRALQTALKVDLKTSYQIFKLLGPTETLATVQYVPPAVSFKKLLAAAKKHGATDALLADATAAFEALGQFVAETTGDFETFEVAVMSHADFAEASAVSLAHRKAAFKADVYFHGMSVDTLAMALMFHPGREPDTFDFVGVRQMIGMRRLRAGTDVVVERWRLHQQPNDTSLSGQSYFSTAFDEQAAAQHDAAVLPDFCSQPMLPMVTAIDATGNFRTILKHRDLGVGRLVDLTTGRTHRGAAIQRTAGGHPSFSGLIEIARPTKLQIIDFFVHRPTWSDFSTRSGVFAGQLNRRSAETVEQDGIRLPFSESLTRIDRQSALRVPEAPRHTELLEHACNTMGWRLEDMEAFRMRIEYPLMDTNIQCIVDGTSA